MRLNGQAGATVEVRAHLVRPDNEPLDRFLSRVEAAGYDVIAVEDDGRRVLVYHEE